MSNIVTLGNELMDNGFDSLSELSLFAYVIADAPLKGRESEEEE